MNVEDDVINAELVRRRRARREEARTALLADLSPTLLEEYPMTDEQKSFAFHAALNAAQSSSVDPVGAATAVVKAAIAAAALLNA